MSTLDSACNYSLEMRWPRIPLLKLGWLVPMFGKNLSHYPAYGFNSRVSLYSRFQYLACYGIIYEKITNKHREVEVLSTSRLVGSHCAIFSETQF